MNAQSFLAIDPGDRWVGVAQLRLVRKRWVGRSTTLDSKGWPLAQVMLSLMLKISEGADQLVAEDFAMRPQSFNRFSRGRTLRLLGALEYAAAGAERPLAFVPPANPAGAYALWPNVKKPSIGHHRLFVDRHACSAWRALGAFLLASEQSYVLRLFDGAAL